ITAGRPFRTSVQAEGLLLVRDPMPKKPTPSKTLPFKPGGPRKSLIEWNDPSKQAHVLDWRQRAHGFGLDVEEREDAEEGQPFAVKPERLLESEEPEAFEEQPIRDVEVDTEEEQDDEQLEPGAGPREDVDLVRLYLQHIGKRKLLKAQEEVAIGQRIENAQRDLVSALGDIPAAVQTIVVLADRIRARVDPAAELI